MSKSDNDAMKKVGDEVWFYELNHDRRLFVAKGAINSAHADVTIRYDGDICELFAYRNYDQIYDTFDEALQAALERVKNG